MIVVYALLASRLDLWTTTIGDQATRGCIKVDLREYVEPECLHVCTCWYIGWMQIKWVSSGRPNGQPLLVPFLTILFSPLTAYLILKKNLWFKILYYIYGGLYKRRGSKKKACCALRKVFWCFFSWDIKNKETKRES